MSKKTIILVAVTFLLQLNLYSQQSLDVDFSKPDSVNANLTGHGNKKGLVLKDGKSIYNSSLGNIKKYRWVNLVSNTAVAGNFTVEFDFQINHMDHWNGIQLTLKSLDKKWAVGFNRKQLNKGQHRLSLTSTINGKKNSVEINEKSKSGVFKIVRKNDTLTFYYKAGSEWREVFKPLSGMTGGAKASIYCWSTVNTSCVIKLKKFSLQWNGKIVSRYSPLYMASKKIACLENNKAKLLFLEKGEKKTHNSLNIKPGGRAVFALQGPLNIKGLKLQWKSSGPIKVSVSQPGTEETIEIGETLLWDENISRIPAGIATRYVWLRDFVLRYPSQRRWKYQQQTANNIFFVTFEPSKSQDITISQVALLGHQLKMIESFDTLASTPTKLVPNKKFTLLDWKVPVKCDSWFSGNAPFNAGETKTLSGVPFKVNPIVLNPKCPSVTIKSNAKAGIINIAHVAGPGYKVSDSFLATYLLVYEDNTTEAIFAELRWNCGVFASKYLPRGKSDSTWWGPPGFCRADINYLPIKMGLRWNAIYVTKYMNPQPQKKIKKILVYQNPKEKRSFAVVGITMTPPENATIGLVETSNADIVPGKASRVTVMKWSAIPHAEGKEKKILQMVKPARRGDITEIEITSAGNFSYGSAVLTLKASLMEPGPVRLLCDGVSSSLLGFMPLPTGKKNYMTMIAGGGESSGQFERMRRLGYDAVKVHVKWSDREEPEPGKYNWNAWYPRFDRIRKAGLKIGLRNQIHSGPKWLQKQVKAIKYIDKGQEKTFKRIKFDPADPVFRKALTNYYEEIGCLASRYPEIMSINANYGVYFPAGSINKLNFGHYQLIAFRKYMEKNFTLKFINDKTKMAFKDYKEITPQAVIKDKSNFLFSEYCRHYMQLQKPLLWSVSRAIRKNSKAHLTFNHPFDSTEKIRTGRDLETYLAIARELGGSPFHETSDRYCLSFKKWLTAKHTFNLEYGDEGNQNPPTYEHNILSYMWMTWMQCWDSLYCQWWGGRPGSQNIAWLKPYYRMIYNAQYMPDPISLLMGDETTYKDARRIMNSSLHKTTVKHYGLTNVLLGANLNPKNYLIDQFPNLDSQTSKLLIDDNNRALSKKFADRIEKLIRNGKVYIITSDTDKLNKYAFQARFGIRIGRGGIPHGDGLRILNKKSGYIPFVAEKKIGKGKLVIFNSLTWTNFDPTAPKDYLKFIRKTFAKLGMFRPLVYSNCPGVYLAPFRTKKNDILLFVINITAAEKTVGLKLNKKAVDAKKAFDLGQGKSLKINTQNNYYNVKTKLLPLSCTVIKFKRNKNK